MIRFLCMYCGAQHDLHTACPHLRCKWPECCSCQACSGIPPVVEASAGGSHQRLRFDVEGTAVAVAAVVLYFACGLGMLLAVFVLSGGAR